jgi:membrane protein implicated in regulation of membrane protease activity
MAALMLLSMIGWALAMVGFLILANWLVLGVYLFFRDLVNPRIRRVLGLRDPWTESAFPRE